MKGSSIYLRCRVPRQRRRDDSQLAFLLFQEFANFLQQRHQSLGVLFNRGLLAQFQPAFLGFALHWKIRCRSIAYSWYGDSTSMKWRAAKLN